MWLLIATCLLAPGTGDAADPHAPVATDARTPAVLSAEPPPAGPADEPRVSAPMTTEEKIEAWRRGGDREAPGEAPPPDRRLHGEVTGWIGSDGVRGASVVISAPIGKNGAAAVAVSKSEGPRFGEPASIEP